MEELYEPLKALKHPVPVKLRMGEEAFARFRRATAELPTCPTNLFSLEISCDLLLLPLMIVTHYSDNTITVEMLPTTPSPRGRHD